MTRPHFTLRGLLLLTVAVAALCWYRDLPRQNAIRSTTRLSSDWSALLVLHHLSPLAAARALNLVAGLSQLFRIAERVRSAYGTIVVVD
jgi:hypothetical protein